MRETCFMRILIRFVYLFTFSEYKLFRPNSNSVFSVLYVYTQVLNSYVLRER